MSEIKILFVCLGNICRSPMAEGAFRHLVEKNDLQDQIYIDSAGTGAWHVGEQPDSRAASTAISRGIDLSGQSARKVKPQDFESFDYILAMDHQNYEDLLRAAPLEARHKVQLFLDYAPDQSEREVPDPYYGGAGGFEHVLDLVEAASRGLLKEIKGEGEP